ncbi:hypothetical protein IG631_11130 [Alternaria alternata]|nr:hypothetical protein IG631_11130 [Alternaria alternata]
MIFKCYEWKKDGRARRVPHSAFVDKEMAHKEPRQSIERTFAREHGRRATLTGLDMSRSELIEALYMNCIPSGNVNDM